MVFKTICKNSLVFYFTIFVPVLRTKRNIAFIFSTLAMMVLLLHGMMPHHHHNAEAEKCNLEEHITLDNNTVINHTESLCSMVTCCEDHQSSAEQVHVCNLNVASSKQISIELIAVFKSFTFQNRTTQTKRVIVLNSNSFTPSIFSEVWSLRAPPLG